MLEIIFVVYVLVILWLRFERPIVVVIAGFVLAQVVVVHNVMPVLDAGTSFFPIFFC